MSEKLNSLPTR